MINVNYKRGYSSGYSIAGTNIFSIIKKLKFNVFENSPLNKGINIFVQIPPLNMPKNAYNIGFFYWEADSFPSSWVPYILSLDEFWSPCDLVTNCLRKIGFRGKVINVPTPIVNKNNNESLEFRHRKGFLPKDCFRFYSIFQWNYRKGYDILIRAYLEEFSSENVMLIIKTNWKHSVNEDFLRIVKHVKRDIGEKEYPKIFFSEKVCSYDDILRIHSNCDCFVLPHRGEGWGIPIHEALNNYNPVITTKFGGVTDYLTEETSYLIDYNVGKVRNMDWSPIYKGKSWAEPDVGSLKRKMRESFLDKDQFERKQLMSKSVANSIDFKVVEKIITSRLEKVSESIGLV